MLKTKQKELLKAARIWKKSQRQVMREHYLYELSSLNDRFDILVEDIRNADFEDDLYAIEAVINGDADRFLYVDEVPGLDETDD